MNTKRISDKIEKYLNQQVNNEAENSQLYLAFSVWADKQGYSGTADLLLRHSGEERNHMMKFISYIQTRGGNVKIANIPAPKVYPKNLEDCLQILFKGEVKNTESIYEIVNISFEEKDWATWNFAQWFVKEQIEEEKLIMELMDKLKVAGGEKVSNESLLLFDNELKNHDDEATLAREE